MDTKSFNPKPGIILATGAIWGLVEFGAGMGLQKCATLLTGAVLTGLSFFWFSFIWSITKRVAPVLVIAGIAMLFKWLDAWLLQVAWNHGSVLNPMFAFVTALAGFLLMTALLRNRFPGQLKYRILLGGGAALTAALLFPLVKFTTGTPACTYAATSIPLAIYAAPVAIALAMITVPLGYRAALWYERNSAGSNPGIFPGLLRRFWSPAVVAGCILIIVLVRII